MFASSKREICAFPAKSEHVALYLQHLLDTTHSHSAVDSAIFGIQWAHHLAGLPSPTDSPISVCNKQEPVSPDTIRNLVEKSNLIYLNNELCVFLFLLSLVFSELRRFFIFDMERLVFTTSLSTLIEVRQINLGKGDKL